MAAWEEPRLNTQVPNLFSLSSLFRFPACVNEIDSPAVVRNAQGLRASAIDGFAGQTNAKADQVLASVESDFQEDGRRRAAVLTRPNGSCLPFL